MNDDEPPELPKPGANGRVPAIEFTRISIARDFVRERQVLGLSQESLAGLAGMRADVIARIESGKHAPSVRTIDRIDRALKQTKEKQATARRPKRGKKHK